MGNLEKQKKRERKVVDLHFATKLKCFEVYLKLEEFMSFFKI